MPVFFCLRISPAAVLVVWGLGWRDREKGTINVNNTKGRKGGNNTKTHTTQTPQHGLEKKYTWSPLGRIAVSEKIMLLECRGPAWAQSKIESR